MDLRKAFYRFVNVKHIPMIYNVKYVIIEVLRRTGQRVFGTLIKNQFSRLKCEISKSIPF